MDEEKDWLYDNDDFLESINRFEDMIEKNASYYFDVHEFENIINYYIDIFDFHKALIATEYANTMYPNSTPIQIKIAQLLIDKDKALEAIELLNAIEPIESSNYEVFVLKGLAYNLLGRTEKAMRYFDKAISLADEEFLDEVLYNIGVSFEQQELFEIAIKYLLKAHKNNPENADVLYDLAYSYDRINALQSSITFYNRYLDEDSFSDNAWFNLGTVYTRIKEYDKALEAYDFAIAINDTHSSAVYNKANVLSNLGNYNEALPEYLEFLKLEENHVLAHCYIGECYEKLGRFEEATMFFDKATIIDPNCADAWFGKGVVKMHQSLYAECIPDIERALALNEDNTEYLFAFGLACMHTKEHNKAIAAFRTVVELEPTDHEAWINYAELLVTLDQIEAATELLIRACDYNFNSPEIHLRLASYLFMQGKEKLGCSFLEKALTLNAECIEELYELYPEAAFNPKIKHTIEKHFDQNPV